MQLLTIVYEIKHHIRIKATTVTLTDDGTGEFEANDAFAGEDTGCLQGVICSGFLILATILLLAFPSRTPKIQFLRFHEYSR